MVRSKRVKRKYQRKNSTKKKREFQQKGREGLLKKNQGIL